MKRCKAEGCTREFSSQNGLYYHMNKEHPELIVKKQSRLKENRRFIKVSLTLPVHVIGKTADGKTIFTMPSEVLVKSAEEVEVNSDGNGTGTKG